MNFPSKNNSIVHVRLQEAWNLMQLPNAHTQVERTDVGTRNGFMLLKSYVIRISVFAPMLGD
jgi:hypothetical protein